MPRRFLAVLAVPLVTWAGCGSTAPPPEPDPAYVQSIETWRVERDQRLRSEDGWLTLVGLHWLEPGDNPFGSGSGNPVALPAGRAPERAGSFVLEDDAVTVRAAPGIEITLDDQPVTERPLRSDADGTPDVLRLGDLRLFVIKRGDQYAVRVKDPQSEVRTGFAGVDCFAIDPSYRFDATFVAYDEPKEIKIASVVGPEATMYAPGYVRFSLNDQELTLEPMLESLDDDQYFFIFRDATSGKETYGAGRYLYTDVAQDGKVDLDFNKAYNPPCVFTAFATCPLPPPQNRLPVRIEAGEKTYAHGHS